MYVFSYHGDSALKICSKCKIDKPFEEFYKEHRRENYYQSVCKECQKERQRKSVRETPEITRERSLRSLEKRKARNFALILEIKKERGCVDCGNKNPIVLHFDHISGNKVNSISRMMVNGVPWKRIDDEIKKCELVCANCHMIREARRSGRDKLYE